MNDNNKPKMTKQRILSTLGIVVAIIAGILFSRLVMGSLMQPSAEELVSKAVPQINEQMQVPSRIDGNTKITDVKANGDTIEYYYETNGLKPEMVNAERLRALVEPKICSNEEMTKLLNKGVKAGYNYEVSETGDTYEFTITKEDCA